MKGSAKLLWGLVCALAVAPASAGSVYRCDSADGGRSYVSKRVPGAKCTAVSQYKATRSAPAPTTSTPAAALVPVKAGGTSDPGAPATFMTTAAVSAASTPAKPVARPTAASSRLVQGQVYSYVKDGVRHYSSKRPAGIASATPVRTIKYSFLESCYACAAKPGVNFGNVRLNIGAYRDEISAAANRHGVDEAIVRAIIHAESAFNPNALSRVGAQGLMQLMPATARRFGVTNAFDANQNIGGGVEYLAWLLKRFDGNLTLAAAGYNAGEGAVAKYKGVPPYSETQRYVQRVGLLADRYRAVTP
ncbi:MAG: transglycosylase SLT domain-containing protein [Pseudomonadota bacterium]|nr:transglycosylase SLT domain-containing protein [Pseudomonadota bacterium]